MRLAWILLAGALAGCASSEVVGLPSAEPAPSTASPEVPPAEPTGAPAETGTLEVMALTDNHHGDRFSPEAIDARVGDVVTFRVVGSTPHTVDFEDAEGVSAPHSGNLDEGMTHSVSFAKPGTYRYYCQYHIPGMRGTITIGP